MSNLTPSHRIEGFRGINNVQDPNKLQVDKDGLVYLTSADNTDITDGYRAKRRSGYEPAYTGGSTIHSLFATAETCLFVSGTVLYTFDTTYSPVSLVTGLSSGRSMRYVAIGEMIYYTNGVQKGYIQNGVPGSFSTPTIEFKRQMPAGTQIEYYNGRLYIVRHNILYVSDAFDLHQYDERTGFIPFDHNIHTLKASGNTLWVGTSESIVGLVGGSPSDFVMQVKADYGTIENSAIATTATNVGLDTTGKVVIMATRKGFCVGGPDGFFANVTNNTYHLLLDVQNVSPIICEEDDKHQYILLTQEYTADQSGRLHTDFPFLSNELADNPMNFPELRVSISVTTA